MATTNPELARKAIMIDKDLWREAKARAEVRGTSLTEIVVESLQGFFGMPVGETNGHKASRAVGRAGKPSQGRLGKVTKASRAKNKKIAAGLKSPRLKREAPTTRALRLARERFDQDQDRIFRLDNQVGALSNELGRFKDALNAERQVVQVLKKEIQDRDQKLSLAENRGWHLQGTIEAQQLFVRELLDRLGDANS